MDGRKQRGGEGGAKRDRLMMHPHNHTDLFQGQQLVLLRASLYVLLHISPSHHPHAFNPPLNTGTIYPKGGRPLPSTLLVLILDPHPLNPLLNTHTHTHSSLSNHPAIMRLITHNMLKSNIKGVSNGFPLRIEAEKVEVKETEFNSGKCVRGSVWVCLPPPFLAGIPLRILLL
jgi:hypothetical protein